MTKSTSSALAIVATLDGERMGSLWHCFRAIIFLVHHPVDKPTTEYLVRHQQAQHMKWHFGVETADYKRFHGKR